MSEIDDAISSQSSLLSLFFNLYIEVVQYVKDKKFNMDWMSTLSIKSSIGH